VLFINLFFSEEVNLDIDIVYNIAGKVSVPLFLREYSLLVGNMQLIHQHLSYLLRIPFEIYH
jgi:hypothetical protein